MDKLAYRMKGGQFWRRGAAGLVALLALLVAIPTLSGCGDSKKESFLERAEKQVDEEWEEMSPAEKRAELRKTERNQARWEKRQRKCPAYFAHPKQMPGPAGVTVPSLRVGCGDFGEWPLTVKSGLLQCEEEVVSSLVVQRVTFTTTDGALYAVNGHALGAGYPDIKPIWKKEPGGYGLRVNIGPLIDRGLKLCESF